MDPHGTPAGAEPHAPQLAEAPGLEARAERGGRDRRRAAARPAERLVPRGGGEIIDDDSKKLRVRRENAKGTELGHHQDNATKQH